MVVVAIVPPLVRVIRPFPAALASAKTCPERAKVGLPDTPLAFETVKFGPLTAIWRGVTTEPPVLAIRPVPEASKEAPVAFMEILRVD
jgi:hypothetical protein